MLGVETRMHTALQVTRYQRLLISIAGILGVIALMISFSINPAPPTGATLPEIVSWGKAHEGLILTGAWLQGIGSFLEIVLIIALVYLTDSMRAISGWLTVFAATTIMSISLVEVSLYLSAVQGGVSGDLPLLSISLSLIQAIQHAYVIVPAPVLLLGLGYILYTSQLLPRMISYAAFLLGGVLAILGLIGTFYPMQQVVDSVLGVQELWFLVTALALVFHKSNTVPVQR